MVILGDFFGYGVVKRHELLWLIEKLIKQKEQLIVYKEQLQNTHPRYIEIIEKYIECDKRLIEYINSFHGEI